jgi:hypothetical protein
MNRNDFDDEESDDDNNNNNQNKGSSSSSSSSSVVTILFEDYEVDSILANHYFEETIVPRNLIAIQSSSVSIPPVITYIIPGTTTTTTTNNIPCSSSNRVEVNNMATNYVQSTQFTQQQQLHNNRSELAYDKKSSYDRIYNEMKLLHSQLYRTCNYSSVEMNIDSGDDDDDDDDNNCDMKAQRNYQKNQYKNIKEQIFNLIDKKELMVMIDVSYQFIKQFLHDYHDKYQKPRKIIVPKFHDYHRLTMKEKQIIEIELTQLYNSEEQFFIILTRAGTIFYNPCVL